MHLTWPRVLVLAAVVLVACGAVRVATPSPGGRTDEVITLRFDGMTRRYRLHLPPGQRPGPMAVMLALHGGGGTAAQFEGENGLDAVADREGFVTIHPDGTGPRPNRFFTWNAGEACCGWAREHDVDDVGFLAAVLRDASGRTSIDPARVYVTGHSNGAMMAYRFAAERADLVAAVIAVSGAMTSARFNPSRPVPVLDIHSIDDPRAPYAGGTGPPFPGTDHRVRHASVIAGLKRWAARDGCGSVPVVGPTRDGVGPNRGQSVTHLVWPRCDAGMTVEHLRLSGVGHGWPGAVVPAGRRDLIGPGTTLVDAAEAAWEFARRY
ncbi:MAG TPA: PHB depolymerase family esterase [Gemmatimonadales bacterium]|nr:PHB depolymerase family esterase [Gemmatimonadales bacterium]